MRVDTLWCELTWPVGAEGDGNRFSARPAFERSTSPTSLFLSASSWVSRSGFLPPVPQTTQTLDRLGLCALVVQLSAKRRISLGFSTG